MLGIEEEIFQGLGLPYQVIDTCTGDLGGAGYRKYDLEAWMPGGGQRRVRRGHEHLELHRLPGPPAQHPLQGEPADAPLVHTLNGTAVAVSRALVAILENYQQGDGYLHRVEPGCNSNPLGFGGGLSRRTR